MTSELPGRDHGQLPGPGRIVGRHELAELFGVVPSSIAKYENLGMPVFKKGRVGNPTQFASADCLWWRIE